MSRERRYSGFRVEDALARLACGSLQLAGAGPTEGASYQVQIEGLINRSRLVRVRVMAAASLQAYHAVVLARSSDWYWYSLHCYEHPATAIIAGVHDAVVDVPVIALDEERWYPAGRARIQGFSEQLFPERVRKTHFGHRLLLSGLLCGRADAFERLWRLPASTRRRILAELKRLRLRRRGRPLALS
ncbi:hypothetical protein [Thermogemmatispora tikiterensis]|uniref:Uncharacterized protein n=1 Tax=Thermogemmatispora tikiterensis TaxID=1825093 RepID=A0A328VMM3_9CHLR|nr:hypothetical protein [Thermogemmatispora tikiterensis]RAQ97492.1 hypothetical protein A4R35_18290 [Thermogemmatispora tikiterensis]